MRWSARLCIVPFAGVTYDSLKLIYQGIVENNPRILQYALVGVLIGSFFLGASVYSGLYVEFKSVNRLKLELERLKIEVEELRSLTS